MTRIVLIIAGLLAVSTSVFAQTTAETIERALAAAPARGREATAVIKWNPDHTYETLKQGTNRLVCYDRSGFPGRRQPFSVQCTSVANLDRVAQSLRALAENEEGEKVLDSYEANGTRVLPEFGSAWISLDGADQASARLHTTIAVPNATAESLGLPDNRDQGGAWIMMAGTTEAHIMVPGQ
jgi:hypothetical protein